MEYSFLFLCAWMAGSDEDLESESSSLVHNQKDLMAQFRARNEQIFALQIDVISPHDMKQEVAEELASNAGYASMFNENLSANNTLSNICLINKDLNSFLDEIEFDNVERVEL